MINLLSFVIISLLSLILIVQGSLEELFVRNEQVFSTLKDEDNIIDWLSDDGKHGSKSSYRNVAGRLAEPFKIEEEIEEAIDLSALKRLERRASSLPKELGKVRLTESINEKVNIFEEELMITEQITEFQQKIEEIQSLPISEQKDLFRGGSVEERRLSGIAIGRISPQRLGGLISGESRRKRRAITAVFG